MDISKIYVHDARLHRVIEDIATDTVTMEVDLPDLENEEQLKPQLLIFEDAYNYQIFEQRWDGYFVTILDMHIVGKERRWHRVRIETNAGYRELYCTAIRVSEPGKTAL